jgi:hypothetical protein
MAAQAKKSNMATQNIDDKKKAADLDKIKVETEKLTIEIENLKNNKWENRITKFSPVITPITTALITAFVSVFVFSLGAYQQQESDLKKLNVQQKGELDKLREQMGNEVKRKFYEKQFEIYFDLSNTAAQISTLNDDKTIKEKYQHFSELYNGNLILVLDNEEIINAVDKFEKAFYDYKNDPTDKIDLQNSARNLSTILRNSIVSFYGIPIEKTYMEK